MVRRKLIVLSAVVAFGLLGRLALAEIPEEPRALLPQEAQAVHLGVASCASSVCHGKAEASSTRRVWLTEFRIWQARDPHATAYDTLLSEDSAIIAEKLGIEDAFTAEVCLDCHSDNVAVERRGQRFQLSDGVGCEACHGGSEKWISSHTRDGTPYAENLNKGMYPAAAPEAKAALCLSCHLGTSSKFASHDIMGAGHPQLLFELSSFSANQPMHYAIDADYVARKGDYTASDYWLHGLGEAATATLDLLNNSSFDADSIFPELAFYQCDGCHKKTDQSSRGVSDRHSMFPSGSVRLNDTVIRLFLDVAAALDVDAAVLALNRLDALVLAAGTKRQDLASTQRALAETLAEVRQALVGRAISRADLLRVRERALILATSEKASYFSYSFNLFLTVSHLNAELNDGLLSDDDIGAWFSTVELESNYSPREFVNLAALLLQRVQFAESHW